MPGHTDVLRTHTVQGPMVPGSLGPVAEWELSDSWGPDSSRSVIGIGNRTADPCLKKIRTPKLITTTRPSGLSILVLDSGPRRNAERHGRMTQKGVPDISRPLFILDGTR